jgi:site-specific DNA-cytosine methylase
MRVLVACEESQVVCKAFRERGHEAYSCDLQACSGGHPEWHLGEGSEWDLIIAHPPCDYLTVTGNKWLKDQPARKSGALVGAERRKAREFAIAFFMMIANKKCKKICIENPVGIMSTEWRKPDQIIQPFQFGHPEPKKTCLWLQGLPKLQATNIVEPEYTISKSGKRHAAWYYSPSPTPERKKNRSKTFRGIAKAMAEQWG